MLHLFIYTNSTQTSPKPRPATEVNYVRPKEVAVPVPRLSASEIRVGLI